jgi:hypothetical protein
MVTEEISHLFFYLLSFTLDIVSFVFINDLLLKQFFYNILKGDDTYFSKLWIFSYFMEDLSHNTHMSITLLEISEDGL